jgi:hypothetical protein
MRITKADALLIARSECEKRGWPWEEPVVVYWGPFNYLVRTNTQRKGGNAGIRIRRRDGVVTSAGFANR